MIKLLKTWWINLSINDNKRLNLYKRVLRDRISDGFYTYLCYHFSTYRYCFKNLKEVKDNKDSKHLLRRIKFNCDYEWFSDQQDRTEFLKECIQMLENKINNHG